MNLRRLLVRTLVACLALASVAGACSGDDSGGNFFTGSATATAAATNGAEPGDGGDSGSGGEPGDTLDGTTFAIDGTFYHSGFEVTLRQGSVGVTTDMLGNVDGYVLSIDGTFTNLGDSATFFGPEMSIVQGTKSYTNSFQSDSPQVGSGLTGEGGLRFVIDEEFDYEAAKLVVGAADETRAEIPFAPGAGVLKDLAPSELDVTGVASLDPIDLSFNGAELRYDLPSSYREVDDGHVAITLHFDATSRKSGNWRINDQDFSLIGPDGIAVGTDGSVLASLPGSEDGLTTQDLFVRFIIDADAPGTYTLRFKPGSYWITSGPEETTVEFELG
jgi:hypothetical protein